MITNSFCASKWGKLPSCWVNLNCQHSQESFSLFSMSSAKIWDEQKLKIKNINFYNIDAAIMCSTRQLLLCWFGCVFLGGIWEFIILSPLANNDILTYWLQPRQSALIYIFGHFFILLTVNWQTWSVPLLTTFCMSLKHNPWGMVLMVKKIGLIFLRGRKHALPGWTTSEKPSRKTKSLALSIWSQCFKRIFQFNNAPAKSYCACSFHTFYNKFARVY